MTGVWSVLVENDNYSSDTFVFKTEAEAVKWREATFKVKEANVNVYHVIFIPFRTFEESMDTFAESYAREEDYECEECGVQVIAADIPENECRSIAYGCLSMAFCKPCYERSWAEHPENPANEDSDSNDEDESDDSEDGEKVGGNKADLIKRLRDHEAVTKKFIED